VKIDLKHIKRRRNLIEELQRDISEI